MGKIPVLADRKRKNMTLTKLPSRHLSALEKLELDPLNLYDYDGSCWQYSSQNQLINKQLSNIIFFTTG